MTDIERRHLIDTAFRGGLAVALYAVFPAFSDIYRLWEREAGRDPSFTQIPFEYPPIGALYFEPFTLLPSSRWAVIVNGLIMVIAAIGVTWVLMREAGSSDSPDTSGVDIVMWVASPALLLFLPINWDVLVVWIAVLGVVALYHSRPGLSGFWHGVGAAFKVFPGAVALPVLPVIDGWRRRVVYLVSGFVVLAVSYLVYWWVDPENWRFHLDFASLRTDIDSTVWGVFELLLGLLGTELSVASVNLWSTIAVVAALAAVTYWAVRARPTFAEVAAVAIIALLTFNKVFKPQYVLWVLPFLSWVRASRPKVRVVEAMTIMQFALAYFALPAFLYPIQTTIRVLVLGLVAKDIVRLSSKRAITQQV